MQTAKFNQINLNSFKYATLLQQSSKTSLAEKKHITDWVKYILDFLVTQKNYLLSEIASESEVSLKTIHCIKNDKNYACAKTFKKLLRLYCVNLIKDKV